MQILLNLIKQNALSRIYVNMCIVKSCVNNKKILHYLQHLKKYMRCFLHLIRCKNSITNLHSMKYCLLSRKEINDHIICDWVWWDSRTASENTMWRNIHSTHSCSSASIIWLIIYIDGSKFNLKKKKN